MLCVGRSDQYAPCLGKRGCILARIRVAGSVRIYRLCRKPHRHNFLIFVWNPLTSKEIQIFLQYKEAVTRKSCDFR